MLTAGITLIMVAITFIVGAIVVKDKGVKGLLSFCGATALGSFLIIVFMDYYVGRYNQGQIDALKGKQTYKQQLIYDMNDTIPVDTIYVKIR